MNRCESCDAILKNDEGACYRCGERVQSHVKESMLSWLLRVGFILSCGFLAYSLWFDHSSK